ncbi:MAG: Wzy polymerase domain-containing protein [Rhizobacter sp.]|nr:Wzy polymerase domain-containing protein [Rhizobacter sp.]
MGNSTGRESTVDESPVWNRTWAIAACGAIAVPTLIAYNLPPSVTFFNQAASVFGWGVWLAALVLALPRSALSMTDGLGALLWALCLVLLADLATPLWTGQPWALSLSAAGLIVAAGLVTVVASSLARAGIALPAFRAMCLALVLAGVASSLIGIVQVAAPQWADGDWIARSATLGRAVGNLRQPNHLCSLLLWGMVALVWLSEVRVVHRLVGLALALLMMLAMVLSASRSGLVGAALLALWGLLDRRLSARARVALLLAPVGYAALWHGAAAWAQHAHQVFGGAARFNAAGDISSSRFGIWSNTLALIKANPWFGVGFGEFNFAWTLTPFPGRPVAFFDHTHNLPLQFAVELGVPLATLVLALLAWSLWRAWQPGRQADPGRALMARAAWMMVLMVLVHSMLEYPLWYAYFLLPAAFALGLCLGLQGAAAPADNTSPARTVRAEARLQTRPLLIGAMLMVAGAMLALGDYLRVVAIFAPAEQAAPLEQRIADGQRSWLFSHHGDYAAVTTLVDPLLAQQGWAGAPHYLLDARLMTAWAKALDAAGDVQRARHVAQRLKEFRNAQAEEFFAPCAIDPAGAVEARPFQCLAPEVALGYRDFR